MALAPSPPAGLHERVPEPRGGGRRTGRFWSWRRIPAVLTGLILLGATGLVLYDVAAVRAGQPAMYWRRRLAELLNEWQLGLTWVLVAACVAMALGLWLLVLALTPGLRGLLPMRRRFTGVRAGIDRKAAALILRDRAMEISGVRDARVRMRRARAKVRVRSHFRELDDVRADVARALREGIDDLGLSRRTSLSLRVRRAGRDK